MALPQLRSEGRAKARRSEAEALIPPWHLAAAFGVSAAIWMVCILGAFYLVEVFGVRLIWSP